MKTFFACLLLFTVVARAASPSLLSFEPTQFDTNTAYIKYISDWTNIDGIISPARDNTLVTMTNQNVYGTWSTPSKVTLLSLGTNQLDMTLQSAWLLNSPTNDSAQVILSLSAGAYQGQHAFLLSQNGGEGFTLPNLSEQYDVPGALVVLGNDWIGTTNRGIHLVYSAPDWVLEGIPTDPSLPGGGGGGGTNNPLWGLVGGTTLVPQPSVGLVSIVSTLADNATNTALNIIGPLWTGNASFLRMGPATTNIVYDFSAQGILQINSEFADEAEITGFTGAGKPIWDLYADSGDVYLNLGDGLGNGAFLNPTVASTGSSIAYWFNTSNQQTNGDQLATIQNKGQFRDAFDYSGALLLGTQTNIVYSSAKDLFYTNATAGATLVNFQIVNTAGGIASGVTSAGNAQVQANSGKVLALSVSGSPDLYWTGGGLLPVGTADLGTSANRFRDLFLTNTVNTGSPSGNGPGAWKLGKVITGATITLVATNYVEVTIDGAVVKLAVVQ